MEQQLRNGIARNWKVLKLNHSLKQPSIEDTVAITHSSGYWCNWNQTEQDNQSGNEEAITNVLYSWQSCFKAIKRK